MSHRAHRSRHGDATAQVGPHGQEDGTATFCQISLRATSVVQCNCMGAYCLDVARLWRAENFCDGPSKIRVHVVSSVAIWVSMTSTTKHLTRTYLNKLVLLGPIVIKSWKSVCLSLSPGVYERLSTLFPLPVYYGRANEPCHQVIWNVNKGLVDCFGIRYLKLFLPLMLHCCKTKIY